MVTSQLTSEASGADSNAIQLCSGCCGLTDCDATSSPACDGLSCCDSQCGSHSLSRLESLTKRFADHGLTAKGEFVQFYQGVTSGGEVYYNAEITPTVHVTADLQAINPEIQSQDTAVVLGLRATIGF